MIAPFSILSTFEKAGKYIIDIGLVAFLETICMNLLVFVYCYYLEANAYTEDEAVGEEPDIIELN